MKDMDISRWSEWEREIAQKILAKAPKAVVKLLVQMMQDALDTITNKDHDLANKDQALADKDHIIAALEAKIRELEHLS